MASFVLFVLLWAGAWSTCWAQQVGVPAPATTSVAADQQCDIPQAQLKSLDFSSMASACGSSIGQVPCSQCLCALALALQSQLSKAGVDVSSVLQSSDPTTALGFFSACSSQLGLQLLLTSGLTLDQVADLGACDETPQGLANACLNPSGASAKPAAGNGSSRGSLVQEPAASPAQVAVPGPTAGTPTGQGVGQPVEGGAGVSGSTAAVGAGGMQEPAPKPAVATPTVQVPGGQGQLKVASGAAVPRACTSGWLLLAGLGAGLTAVWLM